MTNNNFLKLLGERLETRRGLFPKEKIEKKENKDKTNENKKYYSFNPSRGWKMIEKKGKV